MTIPAKANGGLTIWCGKIEESDGDSKETDHTHRRKLSSRQRVSGIISTPYKNLSNSVLINMLGSGQSNSSHVSDLFVTITQRGGP